MSQRRLTTLIIVTSILGFANGKVFLDTSDILQKNCIFVQGLHVNLIRFITKEGFHRDLEDTVEITVTSSPISMQQFADGECMFSLLVNLHSNVYVDPYEIRTNPSLDNNIRVLNNWTDLENPEWLAMSNSTVFIELDSVPTGNLISTSEIKMPIHFRYQRPMSHSRLKTRLIGATLNPNGYVPVSIPLPQLLLRCKNWDVFAVNEQCQVVSTVCSRHSRRDEDCVWISVPFKSNSKGSVVFIPIGDTDAIFLTSIITVLVVLGGTAFLMVTLVKASERQRNKPVVTFRPHAD